MRLERDNEFIRLGQSYVESNGADEGLKNRILEVASSMENLTMPMIIDNLKKAVEENTEKAVSHDADLIKDSKTLDAFHKYAKNVRFYMNELDLPIVFKTLTSTDIITSYKETADASLIVAKEYVKKIVDETHCKASTTRFLAIELAFYVCEFSYSIYHRSEFEARNIAVENLSDKIMEITNADIERDEYIEQRSLLYSELEDVNYNYAKGVYKFDQSLQIVNEWIAELYPEEEMPDSDIAVKKTNVVKINQMDYPSVNLYGKENLVKDVFDFRPHNYQGQVGTSEKTTIYYGISFGEDFLTEKLTYNDRIVYWAIVSLVENGVTQFTIKQLYRTMVCNSKANVTDAIIEKVSKRVEKMANTRLEVNLTEERAVKDWELENPRLRSNLLHLDVLVGEYNGEYNEYISVTKFPFLYDLNKRNGQIIKINPIELDIPKVHKTEKHLALIYYLYEQIERIKKMGVDETRSFIRLDSLYKCLDMEDAKPIEKQRLRDTIKNKILPYWKGTKNIIDFEIVKNKSNVPEKIKIIY